MRRLWLFLGSLPWGSRLMMLLMAIILVDYARYDFQAGNWPVTVGIILFAWLIGWLLKPVMIAHTRTTFKIWSSFGVVFLITFVLANKQWWWHTMLAHYAREFAMWLEFSCGYWFISEVQLQQQRQIESAMWQDDGPNRMPVPALPKV